jgi:hypothetical protein
VRGQPAQFVVNEREQFGGGLRVAALNAIEELSDFGHDQILTISPPVATRFRAPLGDIFVLSDPIVSAK